MHKQNTNGAGFTIVELLIVIVVIAILAAISLVTYTGIQNRAKNNKTIAAVTAWTKAIKLYEIDNGSFPSFSSCIGSAATYDGDGRCWSNIAMTVSSSFIDSVDSYMGGTVAEPDTSSISTGGHTFRGARYQPGTVYYVVVGVSACPTISGLDNSYIATLSGGVMCGGSIE